MRRVLLWHQVQTPAIMKCERRDETRHLPWGRLEFPDRSHQETSVTPVRACSLHMRARNSWFCFLRAEHVGERAVSEPSLGQRNGLGRPIGHIGNYRFAARNPRARADSGRARLTTVAGLSMSANAPCPNQASAEGMAWVARSGTSATIDSRRETRGRAPIPGVRA
jgi:hypothetical protein